LSHFPSDSAKVDTTLSAFTTESTGLDSASYTLNTNLENYTHELEDRLAKSEQQLLDFKVKVEELEAGKSAAIAGRTELDTRCRELGQMINNSPVGFLKLNDDGYITSANTQCRTILQTPTTVLVNSPFAGFLSRESQQKFNSVASEVLHSGTIQRVTVSTKETRSYQRQLLVLLARFRSADAQTPSLLATILDVSQQQDTEEQLRNAKDYLERLANRDTLTNLSNRNRFADILRSSLVRSRKSQSSLALLYFDIDEFKSINDRYGHHAGDTLLRETANRLRSRVRDASRLARLGGDEFALVLEHTQSAEAALEEAQLIADTIRQPVQFGDVSISVTSSIGICMYPGQSNTPDEIIKGADAAMYQAKRDGGDGTRVFDEALKSALQRSTALVSEIDNAIKTDQFELMFQPIFDAPTQRIVSVEALVRWNHPEYGSLSPLEFIPHAESSRKIDALGLWIIHSSCEAVKRFAESGIDIKVCINLSPKQFEDVDLSARILEAIEQHGIDFGSIVLEITESTAISESESSLAVIENLRQAGFELAIDDFGTGYSSLARLRRLSVSTLKLDRLFLADVTHSADALAIVKGVIFMAHELGLTVVAEGVESDEQEKILVENGCDLLQGNYLCQPLNLAELISCPEESYFNKIAADYSKNQVTSADSVSTQKEDVGA